MSAYHFLEMLIVAAAVAGSLYAALLRLAPQLLGRKPALKRKAACSGCDNCGGCAPGSAAGERPVDWRR
ncbi:hypothetical protein SAMN04488038_104217 [Solimonas aquatica]|uniref:Uncharacterized protein n=1 Tax=Solimonas aquatica TaxID=489703 RepID=A0A1H9DZ40_9GAMM|nr:hypothetical protein [Solimonas aquatica]SEQ18612.1 hypothetical protein SAMN04488038_104217 [Solimonas aquatica]